VESTVEHWPAVIIAGIVGVAMASAVALATIRLSDQHTTHSPPGTTSAPAIAHR
jgi:hypothetical protein